MVRYLVTSKTRRLLLTALWCHGRSGSISQLAQQTGAAYAVTHRELGTMWRLGLASRRRAGTATVYAANLDHPQAALLQALLQVELPSEAAASDAQVVLASLGALGAPLLLGQASDQGAVELLRPEAAIAAGVEHARRDATVARALPVSIHRARHELDIEELRREARRRTDPHAVGMFLALTAALGGSRQLRRQAQRFRDHRRTGTQDFFLAATSPLQRTLAQRNTPDEVRRWGFRMNLGQDAFESTFRRFAGPEPDRS